MKHLAILFSLSLIPVLFSIIGCNNKVSAKQQEHSEFEASYTVTKGRSRTKPHFTIDIKDRVANYNGIANVDPAGEHAFKISDEKMSTLIKAFDESNFSGFKDEYIGRIRDLPIMTLTYNNKKIRYQEREAPDKLKQLASEIESLVFQN